MGDATAFEPSPLSTLRGLYRQLVPNDTSSRASDDDQRKAVIAECIRLAYRSISGFRQDGRVHVNALRIWVYRKTRSILPSTWSPESLEFQSVLAEGPGPSLEFLGDLVRLPRGYFTAGPTRAIRLDGSLVILVSAAPSCVLASMGLPVEIRGPSRWARLTSEECSHLEIPEQSLDSYSGTAAITSPADFLDRYVSNRMAHATSWSGSNEWIGYSGNNPNSYDLQWGRNPLVWRSNSREVSLWRGSAEFWQRLYALRVVLDGRALSIQVDPQDSKAVAIALDSVVGRPRRMHVERRGPQVAVSLNFPPPANLFRLMIASGAQWLGSEGASLVWLLDEARLNALTPLFEKMGINKG